MGGYGGLPSHDDANCDLQIYKPVAASTLAELFAIPLRWRDSVLLQRVKSVHMVTVADTGRIMGSIDGGPWLSLGNSSPSMRIIIGIPDSATAHLANTIQQIVQQFHPSTALPRASWDKPLAFADSSSGQSFHMLRLTIMDEGTDSFHACLRGVSPTPTCVPITPRIFNRRLIDYVWINTVERQFDSGRPLLGEHNVIHNSYFPVR